MIAKLCTERGCRNISRDGNPKCEIHRKQRPRNRHYERHKFYSTQGWMRLSKQHRSQYPICEICKKNLTEVCDHWLEISIDDSYNLLDENLVSMCRVCHANKTLKIQKLIAEPSQLYLYLLNHHPRQSDVGYLHEWRRSI